MQAEWLRDCAAKFHVSFAIYPDVRTFALIELRVLDILLGDF